MKNFILSLAILLLTASSCLANTTVYSYMTNGVLTVHAIMTNSVLIYDDTNGKYARALDVTITLKPTEDWYIVNFSSLTAASSSGTQAGFLAFETAIRYESNYQGKAIVFADASGKSNALVASNLATYIAANPPTPIYGTLPTQTKVYSQTFDPPSLAANTSAIYSMTVNGLVVGDICLISKPTYTAGWIITGNLVTAPDTLQVQVRNLTAGAIDPLPETYKIVGIRP